MFCELCVNACPHGAIKFSNDFENAVFEKEKLLLTLNHEGSTLAK
jgi:NADH-quinone oxidoreductase subunit I